MKHLIVVLTALGLLAYSTWYAPRRPATSLQEELSRISSSALAHRARELGDPSRGAILFHEPRLLCTSCHTNYRQPSLGPDLAHAPKDVTSETIVDSLLYPSRTIREGYEQTTIVLTNGARLAGILAHEDKETLSIRDAATGGELTTVPKARISERLVSSQSLMPEGLVNLLASRVQFYDLVSYLIAIAEGGRDRAIELEPSGSETLLWNSPRLVDGKYAVDDDVDHADLIRNLGPASVERGRRIYESVCANCHGTDGQTSRLSVAPAFGTGQLRYGTDPYSMYLTLARGNGRMGPQVWMTPRERYDVIHYIRETFLRGRPDYQQVTSRYLARFDSDVARKKVEHKVERDYGPALTSQLGNEHGVALTIRLDESTSISYDLHTLDLAGVWKGGFLDLSETLHERLRGEGHPKPAGAPIAGLAVWRWGHDGKVDYPCDQKPDRGPLPSAWLDYRGYCLHGDRVVLSYRIDGRQVLESPSLESNKQVFGHDLEIGPGPALRLVVGQAPIRAPIQPEGFGGVFEIDSKQRIGATGPALRTLAASGQMLEGKLGAFVASAVHGQTKDLTWNVDAKQRLVLEIPESNETTRFRVLRYAGYHNDLGTFYEIAAKSAAAANLSSLTAGGPPRWNQPLETRVSLGRVERPYVVDTIPLPNDNPWHSWLRTTALDFFDDGRIVFTTLGGDVWIGSSVDTLDKISWRRYAAGLFEPLGVAVVDGVVYVTCRDGIIKLHDENGDSEADFYERFYADDDVSTFFHAFNFDLVTDSAGNFYYAKSGQYTDYRLPGAIIRVSPDGKRGEVVCTGLRTPNGLGVIAGKQITFSDNEGNWIPASKITIAKQGGFHGYVPTLSGVDRNGNRWGDPTRAGATKPPKDFDRPMLWLPRDIDNSSGGQVWVDDKRFGPLSGRMLHTSYGQRNVLYLSIQEIDGVHQASAVALPYLFGPGIMRARVNPSDGQLYVTGLSGWGSGRPKAMDGGIQRLRYTGKPFRMVEHTSVIAGGLRLQFDFALDREAASQPESYRATAWNYRWSENYGSADYSPTTGAPGRDVIAVHSVHVSDDRKTVELRMPAVRPVDQLQLRIRVRDANGQPFSQDVYMTIRKVPSK